jgi:hypothetical protein
MQIHIWKSRLGYILALLFGAEKNFVISSYRTQGHLNFKAGTYFVDVAILLKVIIVA